jgi:hypothetical protein
MSFLLDPPALFIIGVILYYVENKCGFVKHAKIIVGSFIVLSFIFVSLLLYLDVLPCFFPWICNNLSGSEFMFSYTGIYKKDVPLVAVIILFALYPIWLYLGYAIIPKLKVLSGKL